MKWLIMLGLSLEEEYELLGLLDELQRQEYLKRHLTKVITDGSRDGRIKRKNKTERSF